MSNLDKLNKALELLKEVANNWNEDDVVSYPESLMSFNELVAEISYIELKK